MENHIAIQKTLQDYCKTRDKALELYEAAYKTIKGIKGELDEINQYLAPWDCIPKVDPEDFRKQLDRHLWSHTFTQIGLHQYMDARAKEELEKELEKNAPDFTMDNVKETLLTAAQDADKMFARGIVNVFHGLSKDHKTNRNSPFKINPKAILKYFTSPRFSGGLQINYWNNRQEKINDIDRVFKTLDGKKHHPRELECLINEAWKSINIYEDNYYKIKGFKNGNMHIEFKRQDLLDKANVIIAKYYGENRLA